MAKSNSGFTIVELLITVVVIGLLVSVAIFGYSRVQIDARNSARTSKVKILAEALEKYYSKNGEYPSCSAMTQSASLVTTNVLPGLDPNVLVAPAAPSGTTNSITCTALSGSGPDAFAYIGDGSTTCASGNACVQYTLQYRNENTGAVVAQDSIHRTQITTAGSTLTATSASGTQINLSWTTVPNASGYLLQRATDSGFTANLVTSTPSGTSTSVTGLTINTLYYFRVAGTAATGQGSWSNTASATPTVAPPSAAPTVSAAMQSTNAVGTAAAVTCPAGTAEYQFQQRSTATSTDGAWSAWSAWSTTLTLSVAASQGYQYTFRAQARCTQGANSSTTSATSNLASVVRSINTPAAPTYLSPASFKSNINATVNYSGSCPSGTTTINTFRSRAWTGSTWGPYPWGTVDYWTNNTGSNRNVEYWGSYRCQTTHSTSSYSPESYNVIVVTP